MSANEDTPIDDSTETEDTNGSADHDPRTRQLIEERQRKHNQAEDFDPAEDPAPNTRRIKIKNVYERLLEVGEDDAAERLRSAETALAQENLATELLAEYELDVPGATYD